MRKYNIRILWIIASIFLAVWLLGVLLKVASAIIHILLIFALVLFLFSYFGPRNKQ